MKKELVNGYCIYKDAQSNDLSLEHVLPLSLGGHDSFSISADRSLNNGVASKVDSAISNDFTILFDRRDLDATGHSGKPPEPKAKHSTFNDRKVQVTFGKSGLKVFDVRDRRDLELHEFAGQSVQVGGIRLGLDDPLRFVAKVALSAGYFAYGDAFRYQVDHSQARSIMMCCDLRSINSDVRCLDRWQSIDDTKHQIMWLIAAQHRESCVMLIPGYDCFCVAVGVLGHFMGFINIPAPGHHLVNEGEYRLGHVITIRNGELLRRSFRQSMDDLQRDIESGNDSITVALDRMTARTGL
ncbi:MAG TPA: hypothetical protein DCS07_15905 [Bdellovibrionales bacterium]|nr:hypothetical protein [Bdellovibrionales bacterium]